jgi:hypothetical protein
MDENTRLHYQFGDFDASDNSVIEVNTTPGGGLRFLFTSGLRWPKPIVITEEALEGGEGPLRVEQGLLYAGRKELSNDMTEIAGWTAPFLVPRRFIRDLLADGVAELTVIDTSLVFLRDDKLNKHELALAENVGFEVIKATSCAGTLLMSANPSLPVLVSREDDLPMVTWKEGRIPALSRPGQGEPDRAPTGTKSGRASSDDVQDEAAHIANLRSQDRKLRVLASAWLAAHPTPAAVRAILEAQWPEADYSVLHLLKEACTRDTAALFSSAAVGMLRDMFATGSPAEVWKRSLKNKSGYHNSTDQISRLMSLITREDLSANPDVRAKLRQVGLKPGR